jgi:5-methylthioadenosine/S-adenosylhomocysteine deaminase
MEMLVQGSHVFTDARLGKAGVLRDAAVYVLDDTIREVGNFKALQAKYPKARILGGADHFVLPGIIDAHQHGGGLSYLQRGTGFDFLENSLIDWAYTINLPPELNAKLVSWRHIRNGSTTLHHNGFDNALDPNAYPYAASSLRAYRDSGVRAAYSPGIRDINSLACDDEGFYKTLPPDLQKLAYPMVFFDKKRARDEYFALFDKLYDEFNRGLTSVFLGPSWAHGSTNEYLLAVKEKSEAHGGLPIHIHTLQTPHQRAYGLKKFGKSLLMHLDDLGLVDEHLVLGHAVYLDEADIALMAERKATVTHHASCNFAMRNGIAPVYAMQKAGVNVALGLDEKAINDDEDVLQELRLIYYLHRVSGFDLANTPALTPYEVLAMGTCNAAKAVGMQDKIGCLKAGMKADIITLDTEEILRNPWISPDLDICEALIHRARGSHTRNVLIDGNLVLDNGKCTTIDVESLYEEVREVASRTKISPEQLAYADTMRAIKPYMHAWYQNLVDFPMNPFYILNAR